MAKKERYKGQVNHIDTDLMYDAQEAFVTAYDEFHGCKDDIKVIVDKVLENWEGDGRKAFEKDYKTLSMQLQDLEDVLMDLRDGIIDAEENYIEADAQVSKKIACGETDMGSSRGGAAGGGGGGSW